MQAIRGFYEDGMVKLDKKAPIRKGNIIMLFPQEEKTSRMSHEEAMRIFHEFTGSIDHDIDYEKERDEYLYEKYGPFD